MKKRKITELKPIITAVLGLMFISTALIAYRDDFQYTYELTFLSNISAGLFLLLSAALNNRRKKIPEILFLDFAVLLFMVFLICIAFINEFKFTGAIFFLHVINPLALITYFFIYCDMRKVRKVLSVLSVVIMPTAYLAFAVIYGSKTGTYIYFFLNYKEKGIVYSLVFILIVAAGLIAIGYGIFSCNRRLHARATAL